MITLIPAATRRRLSGLLVLALLGCAQEPDLVPIQPQLPATARLSVAGREVTVELAYTEPQRRKGLKHRTSLPPDHGMLFLFPAARPQQFWMQDTLIGLDIAFLDAAGKVLNIHEALPGVERPGFPSQGPAQFVLEMALGWCREAGLEPGHAIAIAPELVALARE